MNNTSCTQHTRTGGILHVRVVAQLESSHHTPYCFGDQFYFIARKGGGGGGCEPREPRQPTFWACTRSSSHYYTTEPFSISPSDRHGQPGPSAPAQQNHHLPHGTTQPITKAQPRGTRTHGITNVTGGRTTRARRLHAYLRLLAVRGTLPVTTLNSTRSRREKNKLREDTEESKTTKQPTHTAYYDTVKRRTAR